MGKQNKIYAATAPGSIMLFGEHAVLHGNSALVCAIDKCITVEIKPHFDDKIVLNSHLNGTQIINLNNLNDKSCALFPKWRFVLQSLLAYKRYFPSGFELNVISDYNSPIGLGSSAAVTVATLAALNFWITGKKKIDRKSLLANAVKIIRKVQGIGSGADAAASVYGGVIYYSPKNFAVKTLKETYPITLIYSGKKVSTVEVVKRVTSLQKKNPEVFQLLYKSMAACAYRAFFAWQKKNFKNVGELMNIHQGLHEALGVNNKELANIVFALRNDPNVLGAKISGSGMGDCVVALGRANVNAVLSRLDATKYGFQNIPVVISGHGVRNF